MECVLYDRCFFRRSIWYWTDRYRDSFFTSLSATQRSMNELVHRCQRSMPFVSQSCSCCHRQDYRCCCSCSSCSTSIEEIVTWIIVCSSVFLLYSTLKLYLLIGTILFLIYWIYQRPDFARWIQRLYQFGVWILKTIQSLLQRTNEKGPVKNNQFDSAAIDPMIETKQKRDLAPNLKVCLPRILCRYLRIIRVDRWIIRLRPRRT